MAVTKPEESETEARSAGGRLTRSLFWVGLAAWNALALIMLGYTLWMRHHPNVQAGGNSVALSVELDLWFLGNVAILGVGLIVRLLARRRNCPVAA
jgi:uncharacterized membrane protein YhaH (DUF805 family)